MMYAGTKLESTKNNPKKDGIEDCLGMVLIALEDTSEHRMPDPCRHYKLIFMLNTFFLNQSCFKNLRHHLNTRYN